MVILMTGGSGLLGSEIKKLDNTIVCPSHDEFDITDPTSIQNGLNKYKPTIILHLAAATNPPQHEKNPLFGIETNIEGTLNLAKACITNNIRIIYTSTDYLYHGSGPHKETDPIYPPYKFAWSKLGGEAAISMTHDYLILRLSFGKYPFPWEKVYDNQTCSKLYVNEMAPVILMTTKIRYVGIMNIGGPRTSLLEYAKRSVPNIQSIETPNWVPKDTSLDLGIMKKELGIDDEKVLIKN